MTPEPKKEEPKKKPETKKADEAKPQGQAQKPEKKKPQKLDVDRARGLPQQDRRRDDDDGGRHATRRAAPVQGRGQSSGHGRSAVGHHHRGAGAVDPQVLVGAAGRARGQCHRSRCASASSTDGSVAGAPQIMNGQRRPALRRRPRARPLPRFIECQTYGFLPQDQYDLWKDLIINFNPNMMFDS
ncbi:MAG: hypothetical protein V9G14_11085 [Cypionkella sp.]